MTSSKEIIKVLLLCLYIFMATFIGLIMNSKCQQPLINITKIKVKQFLYLKTTLAKCI